MRRLIAFDCAGEALVGTLDEAPGLAGLLIVSGGNEVRAGAYRGMALLAARVASAGFPVFRFDRRGIGDSPGKNRGYAASAPDIAAAAEAFRREAGITHVLAFGNCDAATALALFHRSAGIEALLLANPWIGDEGDALPPASSIRRHYRDRLTDPGQWWRALRGGVDVGKLVRGLRKTAQKPSQQVSTVPTDMARALVKTPHTVLIAAGDHTAVRYIEACPHAAPGETRHTRDTASHSFAAPGDADWLLDRIVEALRRAEATVTT